MCLSIRCRLFIHRGDLLLISRCFIIKIKIFDYDLTNDPGLIIPGYQGERHYHPTDYPPPSVASEY